MSVVESVVQVHAVVDAVGPVLQHVLAATTPSPSETAGSGAAGVGGPSDWATVCPALPDGVRAMADLFLGWAKGFFLVILPISIIVCLLMVPLGMAVRAARLSAAGGIGVVVLLGVAVLYGVVFALFAMIIPAGCR